MRTLAALTVLTALTLPASAGVLPIPGDYCGTGDNADIVLTTDGIGGEEDGCTFGAVLESGPTWWVVSQECSNTDEMPKARIEVDGDHATVRGFVKPAGYGAPYVLTRCD
jgi:hypothetical protein